MMKKLLFMLVLFLFMLSCTVVHVFAANEPELDFLSNDWSEDNLYPEWYGGCYSEDGTLNNLSYIVVSGYENMLPSDFSKNHTYVLGKYSYNKLMVALNHITKLMSARSEDEVVCITSAGLDEMNNCVFVNLYSGSDKTDAMKEQLQDRFGDLVDVSITNSQRGATKSIDRQNYLYRLLILFVFIMGMTKVVFKWYKHTSLQYALQTEEGNVAVGSISRAEIISAIKTATVTPSDSLFDKIMNDIKKE